ncbi:MAG: hypothetical protein ACREP4_05295 [Stenotrophomonas sp.]|uniref:hypothetical protein n=1 Tax=Stenotrophomonas sp. TaxID=69392 RepID=UPI003D6D2930
MRVDSSHFPLVRLDYAPENADSTETVLADMSALLAREQPFVYIASGGFDQGEPDIDERRKVANWMKANKPAIVKLTKAHVHVAANDDEQRKAEEFSRFFENFWGYPMLIVGNAEEAEAKASELLR